MLLAHLIQDAIDRGIPTFDFLRGEEPYKYGFGPLAGGRLQHSDQPGRIGP